MSLIVPEITLQNTIQIILNYIRSDWSANTDKTKTVLYKMWNGVTYGRYSFYTEAQTVFLKEKDDPRYLKVRPSFDTQQAEIPSIFINMPSEQGGPVDGLGIDEGFGDVTYDDDNLTAQENYTRSFSSNYNIVITSDNRNEVIVMYHTLRALLIAFFNHSMFDGLQNPKISGRDLQIHSDIVPKNIFMRALTFSSFYEVTVDKLILTQMAQSATFIGTPYLSDEVNLNYDPDESQSISS